MIEISIPSELGYEKIVIATIASLAKKTNLPPERIDDLKTALGEAVINAIEHGNQLNPALRVRTSVLIEKETLTLSVVDQGQQPLPKLTSTRRKRADNRGWGLFLIRNLMDEVKVVTAPDRNELHMVICLDNSSASNCNNQLWGEDKITTSQAGEPIKCARLN